MSRKLNNRLKALDSGRPGSPFPGGPDHDDEPAVSWLNFVLVAGIVFIVIAVAAVFFGIRSVQGDIEARAGVVLSANGYTDVTVEATGNDVVLLGSITPEQSVEEAVELVGTLPGVGAVESNLFVVEPTTTGPIAVTGDPLVIRWSGRAVTVAGDVSTRDIAGFVTDALAGTFLSVDDSQLTVEEGLEDETAWVGTIVAVVADAAAAMPEGELFVNPAAAVVQLSGQVDSRQIRRELESSAREQIEALGFAFTPGIVLPDAPPPKEQVVALQAGLDELLEGKVVEFETGSAVITDAGKRLLDDVLDALGLFPDVAVEIAGHADAQGSAAKNLELSERRAQAVLDYLVSKGADPDRFVVVGYGDTVPIADNSTAEGRQKNRRIEFIALED